MASKADVIREYLPMFPDMGPTELAKKISSERKIEVNPSAVSTLRKKMGERSSTTVQPDVSSTEHTEPATATDVVAVIMTLKAAIAAIGKEQVRKLLEIL